MKKQATHAQEAPQAKEQPAPTINTMYEYNGKMWEECARQFIELDCMVEKIKADPIKAKGLPMSDFEQVAYIAQEHLLNKVMSLLTDEGRAMLIEYSIMSYACGLSADQRTPEDIAEMQAGIMLAWGKA